MKTVFLMGIKHCGKSTQAKIISKSFGWPSFDTDDVILEITGKTPREIYRTDGAEKFMQAEKEACAYLIERIRQSEEKAAVVATGGGICNNKEAVKILKENGILVFLDSEERIASSRILKEVGIDEHGKFENLPAYIAKENPESFNDIKRIFHGFFVERQKIYSEICDITVTMTDESKSANAARIVQAVIDFCGAGDESYGLPHDLLEQER